MPVFRWTKSEYLSLAEACQGIQIWGSTGAGKTSGSMAALIMRFLRLGMGGIFFTIKPGDAAMYAEYCRIAGYQSQVIRFGPGLGLSYNFLGEELRRKDSSGAQTENIVTMLMAVVEILERGSGGDGREEGGFWRRMMLQALRNGCELLIQAKGTITISDLGRIILSAPMSAEEPHSENWKRTSFCYECLREVDGKQRTEMQSSDYQLAASFFLLQWPALSDRTRSVVLSSVTSMLDTLERGVVKELVGKESNLDLESVQRGKIIIVDMPLLVWGQSSACVQVILKYCLQKLQERRVVGPDTSPVFLVSDEHHLLYVQTDQVFQTTARSSKTISLYSTQSISNYIAALGGDRSESEVYSFLGCLQTQIFHQQNDPKMNEYAASLIGKTRQFFMNASQSRPSQDLFSALTGVNSEQGRNQSAGMSESMEYEVQPAEFSALMQGGPPRWNVEAIVVRGGMRFQSTGKPYMRLNFQQFRSK